MTVAGEPCAVADDGESGNIDRRLRRALRTMAATGGPLVLAVSGGADSMVLMDLAARCPELARRVRVATFDHGTGPWARRAVRLVRQEARRRGLPVVVGRARQGSQDTDAGTEAGWRAERWAFLECVAARAGGRIVTAHTQDDQIETVVLRILRQAGARGLAGLAAPSPVCRPLLHVARARIDRYVRRRRLVVAHDPSNLSRTHARNRVRLDLLPAIARVDPGFARAMIRLGRQAAVTRAEVDAIIATLGVPANPNGGVRIASAALSGYDLPALCLLWPAIAARGGVVLDRRGTRRVAAFTTAAGTGRRMPLSGGWEVVRARDAFIVRRTPDVGEGDAVRLDARTVWRGWRFEESRHSERGGDGGIGAMGPDDLWSAIVPREGRIVVRGWRAGDRVRASGQSSARRVKRYFTESGIPGPERPAWPVVLLNDEIVWVPGVCRSDAATVRSGRSGRAYRCERSEHRPAPWGEHPRTDRL